MSWWNTFYNTGGEEIIVINRVVNNYKVKYIAEIDKILEYIRQSKKVIVYKKKVLRIGIRYISINKIRILYVQNKDIKINLK